MLISLTLQNLAVVEHAHWEVGAGFTCLTGETGAGKSLLVDALQLLSGVRANADWIRHGADRASVEAEFHLVDWSGLGELVQDAQIFLRRELSAEGRSRAMVNGVSVPLSQLEFIAERLFEIHGQHGQRFLMQESTHLALFDAFAHLQDQAEPLELSRKQFLHNLQTYQSLKQQTAERLKQVDFLKMQIAEIDAVNLNDSDFSLEADLKRAHHQEQITAWRLELAELLGESLTPHTKRAQSLVHKMGEFFPALVPYAEAMESAMIQFSELARELPPNEDEDAGAELARLERRMAELNRLYLKYGRDVDAVLAERQMLQDQLANLNAGDEQLLVLEQSLAKEYSQLVKTYQTLNRDRRRHVDHFSKAVEVQLSKLHLAKARMVVEIEEPEWPKQWVDCDAHSLASVKLRFLFSANPGEPPRALSKIASGGELSRVLLGFIVALDRPIGHTLIFDEVDAGIGGETAHAVGQLLAKLGERHQVLCVTHLAQVARFANHHWLVTKQVEGQRTFTQLTACNRSQRILELARLMGGDQASPALLEHAEAMLVGPA